MSEDRGSWAPFGPSEDGPSIGPLPPLSDVAPVDPLASPVPPAPPAPRPLPPDSLWSEPEPEPVAPPPVPVAGPPPTPQPEWEAPAGVAAGWTPPDPSTYGWSGTPVAPQATSGKALTSVIMGVLGFVACPFLASLIAVGLASSARADMRANPALGGRGIAQAGTILGWLGMAFYGLAIVLSIAGTI